MEEKHQTKHLKNVQQKELDVMVEEIANRNKVLIGKYDKCGVTAEDVQEEQRQCL